MVCKISSLNNSSLGVLDNAKGSGSLRKQAWPEWVCEIEIVLLVLLVSKPYYRHWSTTTNDFCFFALCLNVLRDNLPCRCQAKVSDISPLSSLKAVVYSKGPTIKAHPSIHFLTLRNPPPARPIHFPTNSRRYPPNVHQSLLL